MDKKFKLFEEFNLYTSDYIVNKLKIYAEASTVSEKVSDIKNNVGDLSFEIITNIPADFGDEKGFKFFKVVVPKDLNNVPYVDTYENGKKVLHTSLDVKGEKRIDLLLMNYIEATQLYNDSFIQTLTDSYKEIKTPHDITQIINKNK